MSNFSTRIAAIALSVAALGSIAGTADASTISAADKGAVKAANKVCAPVTDDVSFEDCVVGEVAQTTHKAMLADSFTYNSKGDIVLLKGLRSVKVSPVTRVTSPDKKALKAAQGQANYGVDTELDAQWMDTLVGDFILNRSRFVNDSMITFDSKGNAHLKHHSAIVVK